VDSLGPKEPYIIGPYGDTEPLRKEGALLGIILGQAQTYLWSTFSILSLLWVEILAPT